MDMAPEAVPKSFAVWARIVCFPMLTIFDSDNVVVFGVLGLVNAAIWGFGVVGLFHAISLAQRKLTRTVRRSA
jgi:hypothetical protein